MTGRTIQRAALLISVGLWGLSLALPAIGVAGGPTLRGWDVLLRGHSAWRQGVAAWFANPVLLAAIAASWWRRDAVATGLAAVALVLGVSSFWAAETVRGNGAAVPNFSYLSGLYVWLAAETGALCGSLGGLALKRNAAQS